MAKMSINLPDEMKEAIKVAAKKEDRDMSWIVKKAIEQYIRGLEDVEVDLKD